MSYFSFKILMLKQLQKQNQIKIFIIPKKNTTVKKQKKLFFSRVFS